MEIGAFQDLMEATFGERDRSRGTNASIAWLTEEIGELAQAVRKGSAAEQLHELGDVLAWLGSLAGQLGRSLEEAAAPDPDGCPHCPSTPCRCPSEMAQRRGYVLSPRAVRLRRNKRPCLSGRLAY
ncbi:MAG: MazG nucleotide pyrophosphohydrolase domain-containing protein, partial [Acidimicrobiales bacterium]